MKKFKVFFLASLLLMVSSCNLDSTNKGENKNLLNKVNAIDNHWINYNGITEPDNKMMKSQLIPYNAGNKYRLNNDAYVSYFNGEEFIKTELYENIPNVIDTVEDADGIILSFNKENKSGIQLVEVE